MYSYHIFYFPFKWDVLSKEESFSFSERIALDRIRLNEYSPWERVFDNQRETDYLLYNEKNYFYSFVHPVLYDTGRSGTVMQHYERREVSSGTVRYNISVKNGKVYSLPVKDMIINLYSTGVGMLIFHLQNDEYKTPEDVLTINQYGRRIFPPFLGKNNSVNDSKCSELADYLSFTGLEGSASRYYENFHWYDDPSKAWDPAKFLQSLILDLSSDFVMIPYEGKRDINALNKDKLRKGVVPAVDDRMFVSSIIMDDDLSRLIQCGRMYEDELWIKYLLVDVSGSCVQNRKFKEDILEKSTYLRWQKYGTLFGVSRYSFVAMTGVGYGHNLLQPHMATMYSRMIELALVQRASVLKFSGETTRLSNLQEQDPYLVERIRNLYREYIRFVNQIYFREVTAQEQGCELYQSLQGQIALAEQVKGLDQEIEELHQYATLLEDKKQNNQLNLLTRVGGMFLIPSLLVGYFGMNLFEFEQKDGVILAIYFLVGLFSMLFAFYFLFFKCKKKKWQMIWFLIVVVLVMAMLALTFLIRK